MGSHRRRRSSRRLVVALACLAVLAAGAIAYVAWADHPAGAAARDRPVALSDAADLRQARPPWDKVLERLDAQRAIAWRTASLARLARVFAAGTPVLRSDRRLLTRWMGRGIALRHVRLDFGAVEVADSGPGWVTLSTVDRLRAVSATTPDGARLTLPRDTATNHEIKLVDTASGWRIAAVHAT